MQLYFLRHGRADRSAWDGDDFHRPLTAEGTELMEREALTLKKLGVGVDYILTSPLTRALQTAEIVAAALNMKGRLVVDERLAGGFDIRQLEAILSQYGEAKRLMLVGHEPGFSIVVGELIGGGDVVCKKGGLARVDIDSPRHPRGELVWLLPPKLLAGNDSPG